MPKGDFDTTLQKPELDPEGDETACGIELDITGESKDYPLNIAFSLDISGSMGSGPGSDQAKAKNGTKEAIKGLRTEDTFAVVAFQGDSDTLLSPTSGDRATDKSIQNQIDQIESNTNTGGGTDITAGLQEARDQFDSMSSMVQSISNKLTGSDGEINWIVLLTDGQDSGYSPEQMGEKLADEGLTVHTVGIGGYDERAVQVTAEKTQGNWRNANRADEIPQYFKEWVKAARNVIATDASLDIKPRHARVSNVNYTVGGGQVGGDVSRSNGNITIDLPDIRKDSMPEIYLTLDIPPHEAVSDVPLLDVELKVHGEVTSKTVTGDFVLSSLIEEEKQSPETKAKTVLTTAGREGLDGDTDEAIRKVEESDEIDEETTSEVKNMLQRVKQGDKEARETISKSIQLADDE